MNEEKDLVHQAPQSPGEMELPEEARTASPPRRTSVFVYLAILFGTAFLLLLFAYLMQQRDSDEIMGNLSDLRESMGHIQSIDELVEENRALREEYDGLQEQFQSLQQQALALEAERDAAQSKVTEEQEKADEAWEIITAFTAIAELERLCGEGEMEAAQTLLDSLDKIDGQDQVEYWLTVLLQGRNPGYLEILDTYPPLVTWRELKDNVQEATEKKE